MPSHSLKPLTPLGHFEPQTTAVGKMEIREVVDFSLASITQRLSQEKQFLKAAKKAFSAALPQPGKASVSGSQTIFWTGVDQWFVEAPNATHEDIAAALAADFQDTASITEQTGGWCRLDLEGDQCVDVLQRLCALDTADMETHDASRSVIEHIGVFVLCREKTKCFSLYGPRSSAGSLHHALVAAAKSVV